MASNDQPPLARELPRAELEEALKKWRNHEEEEHAFWKSVGQEAKKSMPSLYNDAAKQVINLTGALLGLYFVAISFSTLDNYIKIYDFTPWGLRSALVFIIPPVCWLVGLGFSVGVIMPNKAPIPANDVRFIEARWIEECARKSFRLSVALISLIIGSISMLFILFYYLCTICNK